jgi:hypothetical protein
VFGTAALAAYRDGIPERVRSAIEPFPAFQGALLEFASGGPACVDLAWQVFPTVGINFTDKLSLDLGYRWLDMDYTTGEGNQQFTYDVLTQGPVAGIGFRF